MPLCDCDNWCLIWYQRCHPVCEVVFYLKGSNFWKKSHQSGYQEKFWSNKETAIISWNLAYACTTYTSLHSSKSDSKIEFWNKRGRARLVYGGARAWFWSKVIFNTRKCLYTCLDNFLKVIFFFLLKEILEEFGKVYIKM